jgi:hypothetical protein
MSQHIFDKGYPIIEGSGALRDSEREAINQSTPLDEMSLTYTIKYANIGGPEHRITLVFTKTQDGHPQVSIHTKPGGPYPIMPVRDEDVTASISALRGMIDDALDNVALEEGEKR